MDIKPEPTADWQLMSAMMNEFESETRTGPGITLEPEPQCESDQVCEQAPPYIAMGLSVDIEGSEEKPAHNPAAEGE